MSKLQPNFHLKEFFVGCSLMERQNAYVKPSLMDNIFRLCGIMSVIRSHFQFPFRITSCYRNRAHNLRVNGSSSSQHLNGLAVDFQCQSPEHVANFIIDNVEFDQLIIYDTFIHFAFLNFLPFIIGTNTVVFLLALETFSTFSTRHNIIKFVIFRLKITAIIWYTNGR